MLTTNIDVNEGLTNGAVGAVTNVVIDERTGKMITILVSFDSKQFGQEAMHTSVNKSTNLDAVPIYQTQATFLIHKKASCQATKSQFSLPLAWVVTIHKYQGLTLPESVIDMTPARGRFKPGKAYITFSRVRTIVKLHIINYTQNQIHVSEHVEKDMERLRKNILPQMPSNLFHNVPGGVKLLHINIGNFKTKITGIEMMTFFKMQTS